MDFFYDVIQIRACSLYNAGNVVRMLNKPAQLTLGFRIQNLVIGNNKAVTNTVPDIINFG
jgi:hypothetical protein